ncbi:MAG: endonuclease/exonuclease/phosphatase family protein [Planctomycetaceae bacterium]|nr:endonuclease/exonuclease/phosphatase family protein [Planctomycetaceae bacterium]
MSLSAAARDDAADPGPSPEASPLVRWLWRAAVAFAGLLIICSVLPLLPVNWWWVRLGDYPRLQLLIGCLLAALAVAPFWRRKLARWLLVLLAGSCAIQLYWILPYLPIAPVEVQTARSNEKHEHIRIMTANVLQKNTNAAAVLELVAREQPDMLVLCEVNQRWIDDLAPLKQQFSYQLLHPLDNTYGMAFYCNLEVLHAEVREMVKEGIPSIDATIRLRSGHEVRVFAVHPNPPRPGEDTTKRDAELVLVGREVENSQTAIVLGDMNDVGWSRTTNLFQEVSGLLDPRKGRGMYSTFDATSWIWRYPLDYLFHTDDFRVRELRRLPKIGSDHFPLLVELSYEPDAEPEQEAPDLDAGDQEDADEAVEKAEKKKAQGEL